MKRGEPLWWMERLLWLLAPGRDRESITGDLLEEYRQEQLPRRGLAGADVWYLLQLISFVLIRMAGGLFVKAMLVGMCGFNVLAGVWLGVMEQVLRHEGFAGRSVIAACVVVQALATLGVLLSRRGLPLRHLVVFGAAAILVLGGSALYRLTTTRHFEGFVLVIGAALLLQGVLTLLTLLPRLYFRAA